MAYFLKQTRQNGKVYLQIAETTYNKTTKKSSNKCYQKLGFLSELTSENIPDPISFYKAKIKTMNKAFADKKEANKRKKIGDEPTRNFGYFIVKNMWNTLNLTNLMEPMKFTNDFTYPIHQLIEALTYARIVCPCSKLKTYNEVFPYLYETYHFSLDQIYSGLDYIGSKYSQFIEIMNRGIAQTFERNQSVSYFDCTNYYFEIDFEKEDKQKGPSKENRPNPIIGQALLLDGDAIPMAMKMYPGNESEKPKIRELIASLKQTSNIKGRTIQVADKGLNCGTNIYEALKQKDGYIFSQSVHQLEAKEKQWILLEDGYEPIKNNEGEILYKIKACVDHFPIRVEEEGGKKVVVHVQQKRVAIYSPSLAEKKRIEILRLVDKANGLCHSKAKKEEYGESSKYVKFVDDEGKKASVFINQDKIEKDLKYAGYNLIVTSEIDMDKREIYRIYHNLWKIEDTFRILKSQLDARPVYLQTKERINGHFLICYYAVTLLRILEEKVFKHEFSIYELKDLIRGLKVLKEDDGNTNISVASTNILKLCEKYKFNIHYYYLSDKEIDRLFNSKYKIQKRPLH